MEEKVSGVRGKGKRLNEILDQLVLPLGLISFISHYLFLKYANIPIE
jgi:hypothetical protein